MINVSIYGLRVVKEATGRYDIPSKNLSCPRDVADLVEKVLDMSNLAEEYFVMISLNTKNAVTGLFTISQGTLNSSLVHPREVFKRALLHNAASIMLVHNHPSGVVEPSTEDLNITKRLVEAGNLLGINVLDHVIVANEKYLSFKERSLI